MGNSGSNEEAALEAYKEKIHALYREERVKADEVSLELANRYERLHSLIAGGVFVVSAAYCEKVLHTLNDTSWYFLMASWISFGLSLTATLYAISKSAKAQQEKIEKLDRDMERTFEDPYSNTPASETEESTTIAKLRLANTTSFWCIVIGMALLMVFLCISPPTNQPQVKDEQPKAPSEKSSSSSNTKQRKLQANDGDGAAPAACESSGSAGPAVKFQLLHSNEISGKDSPSKTNE